MLIRLFSTRRLELARIMFKRAIKINPRHTTSLCHLAMLCESESYLDDDDDGGFHLDYENGPCDSGCAWAVVMC
jgi:hypothetical protein